MVQSCVAIAQQGNTQRSRPYPPSGPPLLMLLSAAAQGRNDLPLATFTAAQTRWAVATGLGPLLKYVTQADPQAPASPCWPLLQGAELTARMLIGMQNDAMEEIIDAWAAHLPTLTLLKGISIAEQYYPTPALRLMGDIDFLVDEAALPDMIALLHTLGYQQQSSIPPEFYATHHHLMPFWHPHTDLWVEVHRGLFPPYSRIGTDNVFRLEHLRTQYCPAQFHGRHAMRLSAELQIVYIASHWAFDFKKVGGMRAMLDLIYLLRYTPRPIRWERILAWLHGSVAATYLYLMLTYLDTYHLIDLPPEILQDLGRQQRAFGTVNLVCMHTLINRYIVAGKPVGRLFESGRLLNLWETLLGPGPPWWNLLLVPWNVFLAPRWQRAYRRLRSPWTQATGEGFHRT